MATYNGNSKAIEVAPVPEKLEKPTRAPRPKVKKTPVYRSQRAVNSVIRSLAVLARRGAPMTLEQKQLCIAAIEKALGEKKSELLADKGPKAPKFVLG